MNGKMISKRIAIIGSGIVGQATGKGFASFGHEVLFCDVNPEIINSLNKSGYKAKRIDRLSSAEMNNIDFFMISVPTPTVDGRVDLKFIRSAVSRLGSKMKHAKNFQIFVIRSTVPPGTTENLVVSILEKSSGKKVNEDFGVCMNPEFLREVSAEKDFVNPWMVVVGSDDKLVGASLRNLYGSFNCPIVQMSLKEAEMMKYAHNLLNATKISFFNEMRIVGNEIGADPEVMFPVIVKSAEAMWNPEYGTKNFGPYGGVCLPKDTQAFFTWTLETMHFEMSVLKGTIETNELMKEIYKTENLANKEKQRFNIPSYDIIPVLREDPRSRQLTGKDGESDSIYETDSGLPL